jgi:hypothetical protein
VLRTCQKLEAARDGAVPTVREWLADGLDADRDAVYARLVEAST